MNRRRPTEDTERPYGASRGTENLVALTTLGLILAIAVAGEMLRLDVAPDAAVPWFVFSGLVLLGAQVFSDVLARAVAKRSEATQRELRNTAIRGLPILIGPLGAALLLFASGVVGIEAEAALISTLVIGFVTVGVLSYYAAVGYRPWRRVLLAATVVAFCVLIVVAENAV